MADIDLKDLRKKCMDSIFVCADNIGKHISDDKKAHIDTLQGILTEYCRLERQQQVINEALEAAKIGLTVDNIDTFDSKFNQNVAAMTSQVTTGTHRSMLEFKAKVARMNEEIEDRVDADLIATESVERYIDPITKKPIEDPIKNKRCGHVYDKKSFLELLKMNKRLRCPVAGCGNKTPVSVNDLEEDEELRITISQTQRTSLPYDNNRSILDLDASMQ